MRAAWIITIGLAGCLGAGEVECPDGRICPAGSVCASVVEWTPEDVSPAPVVRCVPAADVAACRDRADGESCDPVGASTDGECHSGSCFAIECGNHLQDRGEACDDANQDFGDGCSIGCQSDETCGNTFLDPVQLVEGRLEPREQCDGGNIAPHDGCDGGCQQEQPRWRERRLGTPSPRRQAAMVYDARAHGFVMFGGGQRSGATDLENDETWVGALVTCADGLLACVSWTQATPPTSPVPRTQHAMAYDAARGEVVLHGGVSDEQISPFDKPLADTWLWDGRTWRPVASSSTNPGARKDARMAYDGHRQRVVLYGGFETGVLTDTWEWDGVQWVEAAPANGVKPDLQNLAMTYDPVRGVTVLFGQSNVTFQAETWEWNGVAWIEIPMTDGPEPRLDAGFAFDPISQKAMLVGGSNLFSFQPIADTWTWDGSQWELRTTDGVPSLTQAACAAAADGRVVLSHGSTGLAEVATTHVWSGTKWLAASSTTPGGLVSEAAAFDAVRGRLVVVVAGKTLEYDGSAWIEVKASNSPPSRQAAIAYDEARRQTVLYRDDKTHVWNGTAWVDHATSPTPAGRTEAVMTYDAVRRRVVLLGGANDSTLWSWDGASWAPLDSGSGVLARRAHAMGHDRNHDQLVVFGGRPASGNVLTLGDTWVFDGSSWTAIVGDGPVARADASLVWSQARQRLILFGGRDAVGGVLQDTWEWDAANRKWIALSIDPLLAPPRRAQYSMTASDRGLFLLGGFNGGAIDDLWELRFEGSRLDDTCRGEVDVDDDGRGGCRDEDCRASCAPLCASASGVDAEGHPAVRCMPEVPGPQCGDGTADPQETCRSCPEDTPPCTPICGDFLCDPGETCLGDCP